MTLIEIYDRLDRISEKIDNLVDRIGDLEDEENKLMELLKDYDEEAKDRAYDEFEERRRARDYDWGRIN